MLLMSLVLVARGWQCFQMGNNTASCACPALGNGAGSSAGKLRLRSRVSPGDTHVLKLDNPINTGAGSSDPSGRYHFNFAA